MTIDKIVAASPDPVAVKSRLEKILEANPASKNHERLGLLAGMLAGSEYLVDWLAARPTQMDWLLSEGILDAPRNRTLMEENLASLAQAHPPLKALRYFKHREMMRICARELGGMATLEATLEEWTQVAHVSIQAAVTWAEQDTSKEHGEPHYTEAEGERAQVARFAVLGMGKLGGGELNISSDIDLIYIHTSDRGSTTGPKVIPIHEFFVKVARGATKLLNKVTEDGFVFRVDLELRPEGGAGELTNSIGAMETYYESYGRQWERQALIKAAHCGGDHAVSQEVLDRLRPFVYRKYMDETALKQIADIKSKIDVTQATKKTSKSPADDIKLGQGGIREIEFTVQALQLLYGGRNKALQVRSTLKALDACYGLGLVSRPHHADLRESYIFLRKMENRIQYDQNLQTHFIPANEEKRATLARLMGFDGEDAANKLLEETGQRRKRIREIFDLFTLQKDPEAEKFPASLEDEEAITHWLDSLSFDHPSSSARALLLLRDGPRFSHPSENSQRAFDRFGPELVSKSAATPWPDQAILGFANYVEAKKGRDQLYSLLDKHRPVMNLLVKIFSSSESLTASLIRQPDILERLVASDPVGMPASRERYKAEFAAALSSVVKAERLELVNSFKIAETIRLGLRRILEMSDRKDLKIGLTLLAEEYLTAVTHLAMQELPDKPEGTSWAIVAAGKLGRREMGFGSDLDLLAFFDYESDTGGEASAAWVAGLIQKVIKICGAMTPFGMGYPVDMRLRPEGESGPLAPSIKSAKQYYKSRASYWERLALVGARPVAGDARLCERVDKMHTSFVESFSNDEAGNILSIRKRMTQEKVKKGTLDIKFGPGGLVDIEFICQWLRMEKKYLPPASEPFTMAMLLEARKKKWLGTQELQRLIDAYELLRNVESTIRMNREQALHAIPKWDSALIGRLTRSVATEPDPEKFLGQLKQTMAGVREVFIQFFEETAKSE